MGELLNTGTRLPPSMKPKGGKLPSITLEGRSEAKVEVRDGKIVKVCGTCGTILDRATGACPKHG